MATDIHALKEALDLVDVALVDAKKAAAANGSILSDIVLFANLFAPVKTALADAKLVAAEVKTIDNDDAAYLLQRLVTLVEEVVAIFTPATA